jgi:hypothetical protein
MPLLTIRFIARKRFIVGSHSAPVVRDWLLLAENGHQRMTR